MMLRSKGLLSGSITAILLRTSWPNIIGFLALMGTALVDTYFVSLISTQALLALSFSIPVWLVISAFGKGLGNALSAHYGVHLGKAEYAHARRLFANTIQLTLVVALALAGLGWLLLTPTFTLLGASSDVMPLIAQYMSIWYAAIPLLLLMVVGNKALRCHGDALSPAKIMLWASFTNFILDPILIFGWGPIVAMGIEGAALATAISWLVGLGLSMLAWKQHIGWRLTRLWHWRNDAPIREALKPMLINVRKIMAIATPATLNSLLHPIANSLIIAILARLDEAAVAAFGAAMRIETFLLIIVNGLATALAPFIAANLGSGQHSRAYKGLKISLLATFFIQTLMALPLILFSGNIAGLFSNHANVLTWLDFYLSYVPLAYGFLGVVIVTGQSLNAYRKPVASLGLNLIRVAVLMLPLVIIGQHYYQVAGAFIALPVANMMAAMIALIMVYQLRHYR
ncbi:MATE family efflux transporter [Paraferrimonas haliotis]|uniref:MATE family efflux transporter n=1 Tax=Paraferrimonas haliotis TaxID=2013866 RepID=A0AA37TRV1_9GAMM|nr:MATE family efflux transporter [Paraferrimonas haliotis]GLS83326.1 MATE family efflux transporter [Paraferrimonas haliotis]